MEYLCTFLLFELQYPLQAVTCLIGWCNKRVLLFSVLHAVVLAIYILKNNDHSRSILVGRRWREFWSTCQCWSSRGIAKCCMLFSFFLFLLWLSSLQCPMRTSEQSSSSEWRRDIISLERYSPPRQVLDSKPNISTLLPLLFVCLSDCLTARVSLPSSMFFCFAFLFL